MTQSKGTRPPDPCRGTRVDEPCFRHETLRPPTTSNRLAPWTRGLKSNSYINSSKVNRSILFHSNNVGCEPAPIAARWTARPVIGTLHVDPTYDLFGERQSWRYRNLEKSCLLSLTTPLPFLGIRATSGTPAANCPIHTVPPE